MCVCVCVLSSILNTENQVSWKKLFRNRTWLQPQILFNLVMFVTSTVGTVCPKLNLLVIWDLMTANNHGLIRQVLPQQPISNSCQFCSKVCGSAAGVRSHMKVNRIISAKDGAFTCYIYGRTCKNKVGFKGHMHVHWWYLWDWGDGLLL